MGRLPIPANTEQTIYSMHENPGRPEHVDEWVQIYNSIDNNGANNHNE